MEKKKGGGGHFKEVAQRIGGPWWTVRCLTPLIVSGLDLLPLKLSIVFLITDQYQVNCMAILTDWHPCTHSSEQPKKRPGERSYASSLGTEWHISQLVLTVTSRTQCRCSGGGIQRGYENFYYSLFYNPKI